MLSNPRNSSSALTLTTLNGEPRIYDVHLGERLGFERPVKIRELIKRYEEKLKTFNHIPTVGRCITLGNGAKREIQEYYLDRKQALFICMKSETDTAFEVQADIIRVYDAYLNGDLQSTLDATLAAQPRLHFCLNRAMRTMDLSRDAFVKQMAYTEIKQICGHLGLTTPPAHLIGKPADQMQLEV